MSLTDELRRERDDLRRQREAVDRRLKLVENLLQEYHQLQETIPGVGQAEETTKAASTNGSLANLGMREAIRSVLADKDRSQKPADVARVMKSRGFTAEGKTDLGVRVRNEMWRMAKKGDLGRRQGRYWLKKEEAN